MTALDRLDLDNRIPAIRERVPVAEILSEHGHEPAKRTGTTSSYHCPLVGHEDRDPSFTVTGDRWRCWSACDRGGDVIDLVVELDGGPKAGVIERLARRIGLERPERAPRPRTTAPAHLHRVLARFIDQRGWAPEVEEALGLTVVLDAYGSPRIRFPFTPDGRWWQDRATSENAKLRWLSPKGTTPYPYQAHRVLTLGQATGGCFITEGISDAVSFLSWWPDVAVVGIPGSGLFKPAWAPAFAGLSAFVVADNDLSGAKMRGSVARHLEGVASRIYDVQVPERHKDVDEWSQSAGDRFPEELYAITDMLDASPALGVTA